MNGYWSSIGVGGSSSFHENELKMSTLYYFPYDGNTLMELCHENNWLWNWKISEKQKTVLKLWPHAVEWFFKKKRKSKNRLSFARLPSMTFSQKREVDDVIHRELSRGNKCDCHEANIVTRLKGTCGEKLFGLPKKRESGERLGLFRHNSIIYYTNFEITGGPCNLIGSNWCDLFPNRTILCFKSHLFPSQWGGYTKNKTTNQILRLV